MKLQEHLKLYSVNSLILALTLCGTEIIDNWMCMTTRVFCVELTTYINFMKVGQL